MTKLYLIISFTQLAVNLSLEYGTLTRRHGFAVHILIRLTAAVVMLGVTLALWRLNLLEYYLVRAMATLPFFLACQILFTESPAQKTFLYFMDFSITSFLSTACLWIASRSPWGDANGALSSALYVLLAAALLHLYFRHLRPRVRKMLFLFHESNPLYAAFPILSFAFFAIAFGPVNINSSLGWFMAMLLYVSLIVLTYGILFSHFTTVYDRLQAENAAALTARQLTLQKKYYEEVDRGLRVQRKYLHDSRHHLVTVATLAQTGDLASVERYVEGLLAKETPAPAEQYCENEMVNAVVGGYLSLAESQGIAVTASLNVPKELGIDEMDLCGFLGNALENAIEACDRIPEGTDARKNRFIAIEASVNARRLIVRVENSFLEEPRRVTGGFPSSKGSGIGLESMRAVAETYGGCMACERDGDRFILSAILNEA
jgi:hypothetical protein